MSTLPQTSPSSSSSTPGPAPQQFGAGGRWMHEVRNELNTAMMAAAAARRLLQDGETEEALANIRRTESACYRCATLLQREPADDVE